MRIGFVSSLMFSLGFHLMILTSMPDHPWIQDHTSPPPSTLSISIGALPLEEVLTPVAPENPREAAFPQEVLSRVDQPTPLPETTDLPVQPENPPERVETHPSTTEEYQVVAEHTTGHSSEEDVFSQAMPLNRKIPDYPRYSNLHRHQGEVVVAYKVDTKGLAFDITIRKSSGHARLDRAAVEAVRQTRFAPARKNGDPVVSEREDLFTFIHPGA
ncbi:MAG TPA: energy transducer TonB [Deltaproteobacteria bacterium]|nr:energy transducer TonB [Deltaproteobacteria bacterium]